MLPPAATNCSTGDAEPFGRGWIVRLRIVAHYRVTVSILVTVPQCLSVAITASSLCLWYNYGPNLLSQRTHDAITTSLWRQNDVAKSFWRRNDVISTRIRNCALSHVMASAQMLARICINSEEITVLITGAATQVITVFGQFGPAASPLWKNLMISSVHFRGAAITCTF